MAQTMKTIFDLGGPRYLDDPRVQEAQRQQQLQQQQQQIALQQQQQQIGQQQFQEQMALAHDRMAQEADQFRMGQELAERMQQAGFGHQTGESALDRALRERGLSLQEAQHLASQGQFDARLGLDRDRLAQAAQQFLSGQEFARETQGAGFRHDADQRALDRELRRLGLDRQQELAAADLGLRHRGQNIQRGEGRKNREARRAQHEKDVQLRLLGMSMDDLNRRRALEASGAQESRQTFMHLVGEISGLLEVEDQAAREAKAQGIADKIRMVPLAGEQKQLLMDQLLESTTGRDPGAKPPGWFRTLADQFVWDPHLEGPWLRPGTPKGFGEELQDDKRRIQRSRTRKWSEKRAELNRRFNRVPNREAPSRSAQPLSFEDLLRAWERAQQR